MRARCRNERHRQFKNYGGRGITICERWNEFENFLEDMGSRPSAQHQLERIDNDGNYEPSNCRWATRVEQANNKRTNRFVTIANRTLQLTEWARAAGINKGTLHRRLSRNWPPAQLLKAPQRNSRKADRFFTRDGRTMAAADWDREAKAAWDSWYNEMLRW
jgi:hypothetical protein